MSLAAYVRQTQRVDVRIIDMTPYPMDYRELDHQIRMVKPDLIGISAITFESDGLHRAAQIAKAWRSDVPVVVGGPHATSYTEEVLDDRNVDIAVLGEGTFDELLRAIRASRPLDEVHGIAFRRDGRFVQTPPRELIQDVDALPFPAWDLVPIRRYKYFDRFSKTGSGDYATLFTSRGCPYRCVYCHQVFGKTFRPRSPENVFREIQILYSTFRIREFEVIDDAFNLNYQRAEAICDLIIQSGMEISLTFPNGVRGDLLDENLIRKLRQAGTRFMTFAVETASPRLQKAIRKNLRIRRIRRNIEIALREGIFCQGFFMLGFPTETREELESTLEFALTSDLHAAHFFVVNPFHGTQLAELARAMGKPVKRDFKTSYLTRHFDNLTDIPEPVFDKMRSRALRRFWLSPKRIWRVARDYPNKGNLPHFVPTLVKRVALLGQDH